MDNTDKIKHFLEFIKPFIGRENHVGPWLEIDQERINRFAEVTGDRQWIHTDPHRAATDSPYGTTVAHGYLTLSLLPFLTESNHPDFFAENYPGMAYRVNYGLDRVRFPAPVKTGAQIRARTVIHAADALTNAVQMTYRITVEIKGEDKPACVADFLARLYP